MFARLGAFCARNNKLVLVLWLGALVIGGVLYTTVGNSYSTDLELPAVESARGIEILTSEMDGLGAGMEGTIVVHSATGFDDPAVREPLEDYFERTADIDGVTVESPFEEQVSGIDDPLVHWFLSGTDDPQELIDMSAGQNQISTRGEFDGKLAYARVSVSRDFDMDKAEAIGQRIIGDAPRIDGVQLEFGGEFFQSFEPPASELLGLASAIVILVVAFGSVLAMGLPIGVALAGIGIGAITLTLMSNVLVMPDLTMTMGVMIGLGVGIDYALFIVTRYREELAAGRSIERAAAIAIDTSGRAVTFAGLTVVISLMGMLTIGISFISGLGIGTATVVLVTMFASVTLLPALLGLAGHRVNLTKWRGLVLATLVALTLMGAGLRLERRLAENAFLRYLTIAGYVLVIVGALVIPRLRNEVPVPQPKPLKKTKAFRWSRFVQSHPWSLSIGSTMLLLVMASPLLGLHLGFADAGNFPADNTGRKAYDLLSEGFGVGSNGPLLMVAKIPDGMDITTSTELMDISRTLATVPGIESVSPPFPSNQEDPARSTAVIWMAQPTTSPQDHATAELVHHLRGDVIPQVDREHGMNVLVSGEVAVMTDFSTYLSQRMVLFFAIVLSLSFLLLMAVFRSVLVPLKAVIMNLISIGASYGVIVALFQWGWGGSVLGIEPAPIEPFVPMMLFAIVFGLSMDYEVFLLSRIREEWVGSGDSKASVANGLAATARVITAAAAIMVFVFGSFIFEVDRIVKLMGFGLAFAVLLDATVVRMLLVPATMELLGDRNWWMPRFIDKILPKINVEGPSSDADGAFTVISAHGADGEPIPDMATRTANGGTNGATNGSQTGTNGSNGVGDTHVGDHVSLR